MRDSFRKLSFPQEVRKLDCAERDIPGKVKSQVHLSHRPRQFVSLEAMGREVTADDDPRQRWTEYLQEARYEILVRTLSTPLSLMLASNILQQLGNIAGHFLM